MRFEQKVAIVTGGARGIGAATARALAAEGAKVIVADISEDEGRTTVEDIGPSASFERLDVAREEDWSRVFDSAVRKHGGVHVLINTAGLAIAGAFDEETPERWRRNMEVNAEGAFLGCRAAAPVIDRSGGGAIVNFSSTAGVRARREMSSYGAAKAAVALLTKHVALRCAELGLKVRANAIVPGPIRTEMMEATLRDWVDKGMIASLDEGFGYMAEAAPMKRIAQPDEVARAALFLASDDASFITGALLPVDGGMCAM